MSTIRPVHVKNCWGKLGQLGQPVPIGFVPPQLFKYELGQLGQILCKRLEKLARKGLAAASRT